METTNKIISSICSAMIKSAQEMNELNKAADLKKETIDAAQNGPMSASAYQTYLNSISPAQRNLELAGVDNQNFSSVLQNTLNNWFVDQGTKTNGIDPMSNFALASLIGGLAAISGSIGAVGAISSVQISASPVADALLAAGGASSLPGDWQGAAALVAAVFYNGAISQANLQSLVNSTSKTEPIKDLDFAINFANQTMSLVTKNIGQQSADPKVARQTNLIKLMLSTIALNLLYRTGLGGMTGPELTGLINGDTTNLPPNIKDALLGLVSLINEFLPKDQAERTALLAKLSQYVDSKASAETMLKSSRMLSANLKELNPPALQA